MLLLYHNKIIKNDKDKSSADGVILTMEEYDKIRATRESWENKVDEAYFEAQDAKESYQEVADALADAEKIVDDLEQTIAKDEAKLKVLESKLKEQKRLNTALVNAKQTGETT